MRASGALAALHIFTALAMSPARMHFCIVARNTSLLIEAPNKYRARSTMTPIVTIDQPRMKYIPQPPSLKCFQTAAIVVFLPFPGLTGRAPAPPGNARPRRSYPNDSDRGKRLDGRRFRAPHVPARARRA